MTLSRCRGRRDEWNSPSRKYIASLLPLGIQGQRVLGLLFAPFGFKLHGSATLEFSGSRKPQSSL